MRDVADAAPYLLVSHGRMADCRCRASPPARASDSPGGRGGAAPCRGNHVSDVRGWSGPRCAPAGADRVSAAAAGASSSTGAAGEPAGLGCRHAGCPRRCCAVPRLVSAVRIRPRKRSSGEGCHARAPHPADLAASSAHAGRTRPSPAGCLAGRGRNDARVRRGDGDYRGRRNRGVPAAVHSSGADRPLVGERRAGRVERRCRS